MSRPHNCRHCTFMTCGDANWCSEHQNLKCYDWVTDGWVQTYRPIAHTMAEDMPWHEYIVIDCY